MSALSITHWREMPSGLIWHIRDELAALSMTPGKPFQASRIGHLSSEAGVDEDPGSGEASSGPAIEKRSPSNTGTQKGLGPMPSVANDISSKNNMPSQASLLKNMHGRPAEAVAMETMNLARGRTQHTGDGDLSAHPGLGTGIWRFSIEFEMAAAETFE